jgi:hypothetical protein
MPSPYAGFILNLAALTMNVAVLYHNPYASVWNVLGAGAGAIGVRIYFPLVCRRLRGDE